MYKEIKMNNPKFQTKWTVNKSPKERGGGRKLTNTSGYIPAKDQIENMILAGERLSAYRQELYYQDDGSKNPEDIDVSPMSKKMDFMDAHQAMQNVEEKYKQTKKVVEDLVNSEEYKKKSKPAEKPEIPPVE